jgi:hypothetical protein
MLAMPVVCKVVEVCFTQTLRMNIRESLPNNLLLISWQYCVTDHFYEKDHQQELLFIGSVLQSQPLLKSLYIFQCCIINRLVLKFEAFWSVLIRNKIA